MIDENIIQKNFGRIVRKLRQSKNLTQEKLAERLDLDEQTIKSIELGRTFISCKVLVKLTNFFNVDSSYFFKINDLIEHSESDNDIKKDINRMLSDLNSEKLEYVHNFICVLRK